MKSGNAANGAQLRNLTDDQAITLRRVAFGESDIRLLRPADIKRLQELRLIAATGSSMTLTNWGRNQFDSLPRATFVAKASR